ncbi:MAG: nuclear transport factor 2 family protein [Cyclobacteriaceae bacterium]
MGAEIIIPADCGNAPKKIFLKDFNIALANADIDYLKDSVADYIHWEVIGREKAVGKQEFIALLQGMKANCTKLSLQKILSHGREGAVYGHKAFANGKTEAFAGFYEFNSAKATKLKSAIVMVVPC